jgi:hypothetical protein
MHRTLTGFLSIIMTFPMLLAWPGGLLVPTPAAAGSMVNDPNGFDGIPWGTRLADLPNLTLLNSLPRVKEYEPKQGPVVLGEASAASTRLFTIDEKFARVMIHYRGQKTHDLVMAYLQSRFGTIDRTPGQMVRGLNQQYNWRGTETEINLTYHAQGERGYVFFESRSLGPELNNTLSDTGSGY